VLKDLILIAEDNSDEAEVLVGMLRRCGLEAPLHVVPDGKQILAYFRGEGIYADRKLHPLPAVLLLDLVMKKTGGLEVLTWMRTQPDLGIRVIIVTGYMNVEQMSQAYKLGAHSFLTKPLHEDEVCSLVRRLNTMQNK
jgi:CheY-like chemotaxis protein